MANESAAPGRLPAALQELFAFLRELYPAIHLNSN